MKVEVQIIAPLKCPKCSSSIVTKFKNVITCEDCRNSYDLKTEKSKKLTKSRNGKGHNPRYDTNDYLE